MLDIKANFFAETTEPEAPAEPVIQYGPFTPILDRVLLKRVQEDNSKVKGSDILIAADRYKAKSNKGIVIAVGEKVERLQAGDVVLFGDFNADEFEKDGEELLVVWLGDIRGYERAL
jgi:co-chaperonin GroES (HSP10)